MFLKLMNRVEGQLLNELPFAVYRKPNSREVRAILQKGDALYHTSGFTEKGFIFAPFDSKAPVVLIHSDELLTADFSDAGGSINETGIVPETNEVDKQFHLEMVQKGIRRIKEGAFDKVVLSRKLEHESSEPPLKVFQRLITAYNSAFCYLWYHPKVGMWLGATPEILLRVQGKSLTTMSLAGTLPYIVNEHPVWGQKEQNEQLIVTDYITNALKEEVSDTRVSRVESIRAGNLWHLRTKVTAVLQNNLGDVVKILHPTPAVCGMPLQPALKFIAANENYDREYYAGFLGELNFGCEIKRTSNNSDRENESAGTIKTVTELFVNLRCMKMANGKAAIYVGGGITKDSIPDKEWQETIAKSKTMLGILANNPN